MEEVSLQRALKEFDDVNVSLEKMRTRGTEYYRELRFKVHATPARGPEMELVDGGGTDWTQKLLNNAKERLIISGIGSERLCEKFVQPENLARAIRRTHCQSESSRSSTR